MGILDQATSVADAEPYIRMLIYGDPGVGKTVFAARFPRPFIIDVENGTSSLRNHPELSGVKRHHLKNYSELQEIFWAFQAGEGDEYDTIVIDTMNELQAKQLSEHIDKDKNRDNKLPTMLDYKANTASLQRMSIAFRDLPKNLVMLCHSTYDKDENTGKMYLRPGVTPSLAKTLVGMLDVIGYMYVGLNEETKEESRRLQISPSRNTIAKSRVGGLSPILEIDDNTPSLFIPQVAKPAPVTL